MNNEDITMTIQDFARKQKDNKCLLSFTANY